ncbi:MAG TPA: DUF4268 domain-containing protein, partial [Longimicrobium sp.]
DTDSFGTLYLEYWEAFNRTFLQSQIHLRPPTPGTRNYVRISLRSSDMRLNAFTSVRDRQIGVELVLRRPACDSAYSELKAQREKIEQDLRHQLEWNELPASYRIVLHQAGYDPRNRGSWPGQHSQLIAMLKAFQQFLLKPIGM